MSSAASLGSPAPRTAARARGVWAVLVVYPPSTLKDSWTRRRRHMAVQPPPGPAPSPPWFLASSQPPPIPGYLGYLPCIPGEPSCLSMPRFDVVAVMEPLETLPLHSVFYSRKETPETECQVTREDRATQRDPMEYGDHSPFLYHLLLSHYVFNTKLNESEVFRLL